MATSTYRKVRSQDAGPVAKRRVHGHARVLQEEFARHDLLTFASAIAFEMFVATIALVLLGLGVLGAIGRTDIWNEQIAPRLRSPARRGESASARRSSWSAGSSSRWCSSGT